MSPREVLEKVINDWGSLSEEQKRKRNNETKIRLFKKDIELLEKHHGSGSAIVLLRHEILMMEQYNKKEI